MFLTRLLFLTLIAAALSIAGVIDFEDLNVAVGTQLNTGSGVGVQTGGFNYTPGPNNSSGFNDLHISNQEAFGPWNGTTNGRSHDDVVLTQVGGAAFSLQNFDFAGWTGGEVAFTVTGNYAGGGSITERFVPDGVSDGPGGQADFQTFTVTGNWTNLASVVWVHTGAGTNQGLFSLDNINVNATPEPASFSVLGLGLIALGWLHRKRR